MPSLVLFHRRASFFKPLSNCLLCPISWRNTKWRRTGRHKKREWTFTNGADLHFAWRRIQKADSYKVAHPDTFCGSSLHADVWGWERLLRGFTPGLLMFGAGVGTCWHRYPWRRAYWGCWCGWWHEQSQANQRNSHTKTNTKMLPLKDYVLS